MFYFNTCPLFPEVHHQYYGLSKSQWTLALSQDKIPLVDLDVQGVQQIKKLSSEQQHQQQQWGKPCCILLIPPGDTPLDKQEVLTSRLVKRGTDSTDQIMLRLANGVKEMQAIKQFEEEAMGKNLYDKVLVNGELKNTCVDLDNILLDLYPRLHAIKY